MLAEIHDLHSMPNIMMTIRGFSRNTETEEVMWMTRHRWKDNNKNGYSRSRM
jgi:hypothetical protein